VCNSGVLYVNGFATASGKARFSSAGAPAGDGFKGFRLITFRLSECYNTYLCLNSEAYSEASIVLVNRLDAEELGIIDGEKVLVSTPCGEVVLRARVVDSISRGVVAVPWHREANSITCEEPLNNAKTPLLKNVKVVGIRPLKAL
jgi:predicted molibdopterin-dependent oxidoreductase YjgC